jgi:hypothetical protein
MGTVGTPACAAQINSLFQSAFRDLSRATYLITQWKASWDETIRFGGSMLQHHQQQQQQVFHHPAVAVSGIPPSIPAMQYNGQYDMGGLTASTLSVAAAAAHQQHTQQQMNALMAPAASVPLVHRPPPQQQGGNNGGGGEEKNNYDLSDFYEEV